jgi:pimeloyl-ACP methyl ester carboxylesterase
MLLVVLSIYAAYLLVIALVQDRLLFPRFVAKGRASGFPARFERIALDRGDFSVEGRFLPAAETTGPATSVVLFHGNAMLAEDWIGWADALSARGFHVLLPEFRGYADSGGRPTRAGLVEDAAEFVRRVRTDQRVDAGRIALYGRSIGGMVAA